MAVPVGTDILKLIQDILALVTGGGEKTPSTTPTPSLGGGGTPSPYLAAAPVAPSATPGPPPYIPGVTPSIPEPALNQDMRYPYYPLEQVPDMPRQFEILQGVGTKQEGEISLGGGAVGAPSGPEVTGTTMGATTVKATKDKSWEERFYEAHGRAPNTKDYMDREWSEQHAGLHGHPPTEDEWKWNYYNPNPDLMKKYFGTSGSTGYYSQTQPDVEVPEPLGELAWWGPSGAPPILRPWASWFQELVEMNRLTPIAFPFDTNEAAEAAEGVEAGGQFPIEGYTSTRGVLDRLQGLLGLEYEEEADPTEKWQSFINVIPSADFEAQQLLASLRYSPDQNWYTVDIGQLINPRYL